MEQIGTMNHTMNVSQSNTYQPINVQEINVSQTNASQTNTKKTKNNYKNMMLDLMKPLPKEDKPNIHLGGGIFPKMEKI